jgi:hypothetical protein
LFKRLGEHEAVSITSQRGFSARSGIVFADFGSHSACLAFKKEINVKGSGQECPPHMSRSSDKQKRTPARTP